VDREIILVSGAPGSGKSTLAGHLCVLTGLSLLSKDVIKEALWDALRPPTGDLFWSRRLGGAAMEVLWAIAASSSRVILEANFRPHSEYERSKLAGLSDRIVEVYCWCPPALAAERYAKRATASGHHPAHVTTQLDPDLQAEFDAPVGLGPVIEVDTTHRVDPEAIARDAATCLLGLRRNRADFP
jgi:predicted kinase